MSSNITTEEAAPQSTTAPGTQRSILDLSLKEMFQRWQENMASVFQDLVMLYEKRAEYTKYFSQSASTGEDVWEGVKTITADVFEVLNTNDRLVYVGITMIALSILLHLLKFTS